MRILHVNKFLYRRGGAEGYMLDLAALQAGAGTRSPSSAWTTRTTRRGRTRRTSPRRSSWSRRRRACRAEGAAARMVWSPAGRRGMAQVVSEFRPDVVHVHNVYHQLSPSVLRPLAASGCRGC